MLSIINALGLYITVNKKVTERQKKQSIDQQKFIELYNLDYKHREIADALKISIGYVAKLVSDLQREGKISVRNKEVDYDKIIALYNEGKRSGLISEELGISKFTIKNVLYKLRNEGIISRDSNEKSNFNQLLIDNSDEILHQFQVGVPTVTILKNLMLKPTSGNQYKLSQFIKLKKDVEK